MRRRVFEKSFNPFALSLLVVVCSSLLLGQEPPRNGIGAGDPKSDARRARILSKPDPELPKDILAGSQGIIVLRAVLSADGKVTDVRVVRVTPNETPKETVKIVKERAIAAAKLIKFIPATREGRPVSAFVQLEYHFPVPEKDAKPAARTPDDGYSTSQRPRP